MVLTEHRYQNAYMKASEYIGIDIRGRVILTKQINDNLYK